MAMIEPGMHCLVFHKDHAWIPGIIEDFTGGGSVVCVTVPKKETLTNVKEQDIFICDDKAAEEDVNDLLNLSVLHDGTLLNCLRHRYFKDIVYTNIGAIVVALNPFNFKIPWYMDDKMPSYLAEGDTIQSNLPHSWAVAHNTYYEMRVDGGNQCILVSGESGAGKTEASKIVMKYLGAVSSLRGQESEKLAGQQMCLRMMQSNPILEAFGNAKTVRNDNSSRFGKLMKIKFNANGVLTGAEITKYLLEKSRIITSSTDERVYHSFYLLLKGKEGPALGLQHVSAYRSVTNGSCTDVEGMDDAEEFDVVQNAMQVCGIRAEDSASVWRSVAGVLALQRLDFDHIDDDKCGIKADTERNLTDAAQFWSIDADRLRHELLTTTIEVQKQRYEMTMNKIKSIDARDSICKAVYDQLFSWLVTSVNATMDSTECDNWIALLDIFGFEDFKQNSFEQLCINLTNETLQAHYNSYIFTRDMEECRLEGIDTTEIKFPDNRPCLDMISGKGGILPILDEDCLLGKATDLTFLDKISAKFAGKNPFFEMPKLAKVPSFRVVHYAGTVTYDVENFLEKNRDTLKNAFKDIMRASSDSLIKTLLPPVQDGAKMTVGGFFRNQLKELMDLINSTNPHWIRCIKPDPAKKPLRFNGQLTLTQLRSSGVLGTVQIRKAGYPIRIKLADFARKYKVLACGIEGVDMKNAKQMTETIYKSAGFSQKMAQVGKTRAFLKSEAYQTLEVLKKQRMQVFANVIVKAALGGVAKHRTAAFYKNRQVEVVQAFLQSRAAQAEARRLDFGKRKDQIIAQVKALLVFQKEEELMRIALQQEYEESLLELRQRKKDDMAHLEAKWWAGKALRDEADLRRIIEQEAQERSELLAKCQQRYLEFIEDYEESEKIAREEQEERESEERRVELLRLKEEEDRRVREEELRREQEIIEAKRRKDRLCEVAKYYWNQALKETADAKRRSEHEHEEKHRQMSEAMANTALNVHLLRNEKILQQRQKEEYPGPRFRFDTKEYVVDIGSPGQTSGRGAPSSSLSSASRIGSQGMFSRHMDVSGIGGLNPQFVVPANERVRSLKSRLAPDCAGSLHMVEKMRQLQRVRETSVLVTPTVRHSDARNPMNPSSPDWEVPANELLELPNGQRMKISADMPIPSDGRGRTHSRMLHSMKSFVKLSGRED